MRCVLDDLKGWALGEYVYLIGVIGAMVGLSIYWQDTPMGMVSSATGIVCVVLAAKGKISNYVWGLINVVLYGYIAYQTKYYGDAMLNFIYYFPMQFYGFYLWKKLSNNDTSTFKFKRMSWKQRGGLVALSCGLIALYSLILKELGGNLPLVDSTSTVLSVISMFLMAKGYLEQWAGWIVVNIVSIIMWTVVFMQGGESVSTLIMWSVYLINALYGFYKWNRATKEVPCL